MHVSSAIATLHDENIIELEPPRQQSRIPFSLICLAACVTAGTLNDWLVQVQDVDT